MANGEGVANKLCRLGAVASISRINERLRGRMIQTGFYSLKCYFNSKNIQESEEGDLNERLELLNNQQSLMN